MEHKITHKLGARILLVMGAVLVVCSLVFLGLFVPLYQQQLLRQREAMPIKIGGMLQFALQRAMLLRDLDGLRAMVSDLGQTPGIVQVTILDPGGEARFASDPAAIGRRFDLATVCAGCAADESGAVSVGVLTDAAGREVMRSLRAVPNQPMCGQCHGPVADHPVNGYLLIDYMADDVRGHAWVLTGLLAGSGLLVLLGALAATWLALRHAVLRPLKVLADSVGEFAQADFSARAALERQFAGRGDELADLGAGFVTMADQLEATIGDLRRHDAFLQGLIDAIPDGVRVVASDYSVIAANQAHCASVGLTLEEVLARPCYASSHKRQEPCAPTLVVCPLEVLARGTPAVRCAQNHVRASGEAFPVEVVAAPLADPEEPRRLMVESIRDLAQQTQISHEQRLSELGQLAAGVAHEIYNPLASIRLGLHAVRRAIESGQQGPETLEFIGAANTEIDRSLVVTERLMRLSRTPQDSGVLLDVAQVARDMAALLRFEAELRGAEIHLVLAAGARVIADEGDVGMILVNLMQNALHAMSEGGTLTVRAEVTDAQEVVIVVADTGVGIPQENLRKIFHPFWSWRADGSIGSGLGLAICKSLVTKWGGTISVTSVEGEGAAFEVRFPHADKVVTLQ